jgi:creatinine amidohydrolase
MQLTDLTWRQVAELPKETPVIFPVAAVEQHGGHMPLMTDSMLLGEVVRRAAGPLADRVLFAPLVWLGNSDHHLDFAGTLSAPPRVYLDILAGLIDNFVAHGFTRLMFINGHGGNIVPGQQAVFEARQRYRQRGDLLLLFATYWTLGGQPWMTDPTLVQRQMGHACEWETSMMLRIAPHLVGDLSQLKPVEFGMGFEPATRGWITKDRTKPGHIGDPQHATAEKGENLINVFAADVVAMVERVIAWNGRDWNG